ncbi:MAG: cupin domain-containing protein [Bdellovibrionales bacterium]|nr:cupin domain-containing protein [Bdellovibrionales bacterium]
MIKIEELNHFKTDEQKKYHQKLRGLNLAEGYSYDEGELKPRPYWPTEPVNNVEPCLWQWSDLHDVICESGRLVGVGHGGLKYDRRVIALTNPGLEDQYAITSSFFADFQLIQPGESTPSHRHTPCASRFIFEGSGWTIVGDERVDFQPKDIVFTGQNPWHNHGNSGKDDLLFLDILDIPLMQYLGISKWEFDYWSITGSKEDHHTPHQANNFPNELYTKSHLRPRFGSWKRNSTNFAHLRWEEARQTLMAMEQEKGSLYDGILLEFTNTETGGSIGPTMSIFTQMLRPGEKTLSHRHTSQTIYIGVEGSGKIFIGDKEYDWKPNDVFVVPSWVWHHHENHSSKSPAFMHSISDATLTAKLNMYREQQKDIEGQIVDSFWQSEYLRNF